MTYSTQEDLHVLIDQIDITYDWVFSPITFFGTGLNDMSIFATQPLTESDIAIHWVVRISRVEADPNFFQISSDNGARFWGNQPITVGVGIAIGRQGIRIDFGSSDGHTLGDYWKFTTTPESQVAIREFAYDWVNDNLERIHYEIPIPSPSKTLVLAEATYAIYLYLRASNDARSAAFHQEAIRLITLLTTFKVAAGVPLETGREIREAARVRALEKREAVRARRARIRETETSPAFGGIT